MAKYNIIANSNLTCLTGPGLGNTTLTYNQLSSLYDSELDSTKINLNASNVLFLEADFSSKIRVDNFRMYLSNYQVLNNINFYYKEYSYSDNYILLDKQHNGEYYFVPNLPTIFTPEKVLITISGVATYFSELVVYNEDYSVSFGEDGNQTMVDIRDSESDNLSDAHVLKIKNQSSVEMATAYVCVDYSASPADDYIKLSNDNKYFYGVLDGVSLKDDSASSTYRWSYGYMDNITIIDNIYITIDDVSQENPVGIYTTQIFNMENYVSSLNCPITSFNRHSSSFLVTKSTCSGTSVIKTDPTDNDYTIEVRSSNSEPESKRDLLYISGIIDSGNTLLTTMYSKDLKTNVETAFCSYILLVNGTYATSTHFVCLGICEVSSTGDIVMTMNNKDSNHGQIQTYRFNKYGVSYSIATWVPQLPANYWYSGSQTYSQIVDRYSKCQATHSYYWILPYYNDKLECLALVAHGNNDSYPVKHIYFVENVATFSTCKDSGGNSVWYISALVGGVTRLSYSESTEAHIPVISAKYVAGNYDGGCWILEESTRQLQKYEQTTSDSAEIQYIKTISKDSYVGYNSVKCISNDKTGKDGLWYINGPHVIHIDSYGITLSETYIAGSTMYNKLVVSLDRVLVIYINENYGNNYAATSNPTVTLDASGNIIDSYNLRTPHIRIIDYSYYTETGEHLLPYADDPVWGDEGTLEWKKVALSGYFLPKTKYHQTRFVLRTTQSGVSPVLSNVTIPLPVIIPDIPVNSTKDLYIKTAYTGNEDQINYTTKLRCWWYI